ncbi:ribonuclease H-like domain-containing protein [Pisolithus marmoratus]|nr:ribonuclease H-like domain-containing protein [Pisolithus marmoratus]
MPKAPKLTYYAVRRGRQPGIYLSWEDCYAQVKGFAGSLFKKFPTETEAEAFITAEGRVSHASARETLSAPINYQSVTRTSAVVAGVAQSTGIRDADELEFDVVYCDGACKGNGGTGSRAGIGVWWGHNDPRNLSERCPGDQTNNRAELIAIVRILETTPPLTRKLLIKTDSQYSIGCRLAFHFKVIICSSFLSGVTSWIFKWMTNGFRTADGKPVKNRALIKYLAALLHARRITSQTVDFEHVRGHVGLEGNEAADRLATLGASQPPLPERDWEYLEQSVSKNAKWEKQRLDEGDIQVLRW